MPEATTSITISLPDDLAERVDEAMKRSECSFIEFLQEAVRRHAEECEWQELLRYGEARAREQGIKPEDVVGLVKKYRTENGPA